MKASVEMFTVLGHHVLLLHKDIQLSTPLKCNLADWEHDGREHVGPMSVSLPVWQNDRH